jgi:pimeloyl-ACP methyl ester carboxylesterase
MSDVETTIVTTPDGRELCLEIAGNESDRPVLGHIGTPNSRHLFSAWIEDAQARGVRLISYDRPGYGRSTPQPDHTVADGADDVRAIAGALGIDRLAIWGWSGGGPYALACAALLPDLVVATATIGSIAPWGAPGLDFFAGMGEENVDEIKLYFSDPEASRRKSREELPRYIGLTSDEVISAFKTLLSPLDAAVLTGDFAEWLVRGMDDGLAPGDQGWWDDGVAHLSDWEFALDSIRVPVKVWHGRHDRFVPLQHGQWLAAHVPGAESALSDTEGHLTVPVGKIGDVHEWLLSHF